MSGFDIGDLVVWQIANRGADLVVQDTILSESEIEVLESEYPTVPWEVGLVDWVDMQEESRLHVSGRTRFFDECQPILVEVDVELGARDEIPGGKRLIRAFDVDVEFVVCCPRLRTIVSTPLTDLESGDFISLHWQIHDAGSFEDAGLIAAGVVHT